MQQIVTEKSPVKFNFYVDQFDTDMNRIVQRQLTELPPERVLWWETLESLQYVKALCQFLAGLQRKHKAFGVTPKTLLDSVNGETNVFTKVMSSNIDALAYEGQVLKVKFRNGSEYHYDNVAIEVYEELLITDSVGSSFNRIVKSQPGRYPFRRHENQADQSKGVV